MRQLKYALLFFVCAPFFSCSKDDNDNSNPDEVEAVTLSDVSYDASASSTMDVYLPKDRSAETSFVILIHGGGWTAGDKSDLHIYQDSLRARGIASASINYTYASATVHYDSIMTQIKNAVNYIYSKADDWKISSKQFVMAGVTEGAHLALLYTYEFDASDKINAVVSISGTADLTNVNWLNYSSTISFLNNVEFITGAEYTVGQSLDAAFSLVSPLKHIKDVPTLIIHGENDAVVSYSAAQDFAATLSNDGVMNKLVMVSDGSHNLNFSNSEVASTVSSETSLWVEAYADGSK